MGSVSGSSKSHPGRIELHLVDGSHAFLDDGPRPWFYRLIRLSPIVAFGVPHPLFLQGERREAESRYVGAPSLDLAGYVRVAAVAPRSVRYHGDDLARHSLEEASRAQGEGTVRSEDAAGDGVPLDGKGDEVDLPAHDEIFFFRLRLLSGGGLRVGIDAEPPAVGGDIVGSFRVFREDQITRGDRVLGAVLAPAPRGESPPLILVIDLQYRHRLTDHGCIRRQGDLVLDNCFKGRELLVVVVGVDDNLIDKVVQLFFCFSAHPWLLSSSTRRSEALLFAVAQGRLRSSSFPWVRCRTVSMAL